MANYDFNKDVIIGESGEEVIRNILESFGYKYIGDNKNSDYDIKMSTPNGKIKTFEIKTDVYCKPPTILKMPFGNVEVKSDTGNLFVEYECRGKPSGIRVTKSDYFVTYFKYLDEIWFIKTDKLKSLLNEYKFNLTKYSGDQGSNTKGYLICRKDFQEHFKVYFLKNDN